jgi:MFS family permease
MILEGTIFWAGLSFLQGDTVITNFIRLTTGSAALAGFASTTKSLCWLLGQFVLGLFIHKFRSQSRLMAVAGFMSRPLILLMALVMMLNLPGAASAWLFLPLYALFFLTDGMLSLCWLSICTRTLPIARRGEVISIQQTFGGIAGLGVGWALRTLLGSGLSFQTQYAVIFTLAGALMMLDAVALALIKDVPHASAPGEPPVHPVRYIRRMLPILKDEPPVRRSLIARMLYTLTLMAAPINLMFGREAGLTESQLAVLVFMPFAGQIVSGVLWSQVCRRLSYPVLMRMAQALGILCALANIACYLLAEAGLPVMAMLSVAMVLVAINTAAGGGFYQHMIAETPEEKHSDATVLSALMMAPLSFGTYLAGAIVERAGYLPVYLIALAAGTVGWILLLRLVPVTAK